MVRGGFDEVMRKLTEMRRFNPGQLQRSPIVKREKTEAGIRLIPESTPDHANLRCKLEREVAPARQGKNAHRVVLHNSLRSTHGLARQLQRETLVATGIVWQVVEA